MLAEIKKSTYHRTEKGASDCVMASKPSRVISILIGCRFRFSLGAAFVTGSKTFTSDFDSRWVLHAFVRPCATSEHSAL